MLLTILFEGNKVNKKRHGLFIGILIISGVLFSGVIFFNMVIINDKFPLYIIGGSLIEYNPYSNAGIIWNQGFNLTLVYNSSLITFQRVELTIQNLAFSKNCIITGNTSEDVVEPFNDTLLLLIPKLNKNRQINILSDSSKADSVKFSAIGDTQGFREIFSSTLSEAEGDFLLHLGDITPFGSEEQFALFKGLSITSSIPVFFTPGNHDIKESNGTKYYQSHF